MPATKASTLPPLFHLHLDTVERSKGGSATHKVAYATASRLYDKRLDATYDYRNKPGVEPLGLALPAAAGPQIPRGRGDFWRAAEAASPRRDAVVARTLDPAFPKELNGDREAERRLALEFTTWLAETYHVAVDGGIHRDPAKENHHLDLVITAKAIGAGGFEKKVEDLDAIACSRAGKRPAAETIRARWAELCNIALAAKGSESRVDHRSYRRQGLAIVPGIHIGAAAMAMQKRLGYSERYALWEERQEVRTQSISDLEPQFVGTGSIAGIQPIRNDLQLPFPVSLSRLRSDDFPSAQEALMERHLDEHEAQQFLRRAFGLRELAPGRWSTPHDLVEEAWRIFRQDPRWKDLYRLGQLEDTIREAFPNEAVGLLRPEQESLVLARIEPRKIRSHFFKPFHIEDPRELDNAYENLVEAQRRCELQLRSEGLWSHIYAESCTADPTDLFRKAFGLHGGWSLERGAMERVLELAGIRASQAQAYLQERARQKAKASREAEEFSSQEARESAPRKSGTYIPPTPKKAAQFVEERPLRQPKSEPRHSDGDFSRGHKR